jgi:ABC-type sugar transport system permease subunit
MASLAISKPAPRFGSMQPIMEALRPQLRPLAFLMPAFVLVAAVSFLPLGYAIVQSFFRADYLELGTFTGLRNYADFLFTQSGIEAIVNSLYYTAGSVAVAVPLGFILAICLNQPIPLRGFFRTILIVPWLVSSLASALLWLWILNADFGPLAYIVQSFGGKMPAVLSNEHTAMPFVILANSWSAYPLIMLFVLAALQTVPNELLEAARIDGASAWHRFWYIVFPLIKDTTLVALVLTTLHAFKNVELILVMTGGGPLGETQTMAFKVFQEGFRFYRTGIAAAGAVTIFLVNIAFTMAFIRVLRHD